MFALLDVKNGSIFENYNEVITTYRRLVPAITAVLIMQPPILRGKLAQAAGARYFRATHKTARLSAVAIKRASGRNIPILCLRRAPRPDEPAIVALAECIPNV